MTLAHLIVLGATLVALFFVSAGVWERNKKLAVVVWGVGLWTLIVMTVIIRTGF